MMIPPCGPPSSLSALAMTRSAPAVDGAGERRLRRQTEARCVEKRAAAKIFQNRQPVFARQDDQLGRRRGVDKPERPEIARVHLQNRRRSLHSSRPCIVAGVGPVRGADLDQPRPRLAQDVRYPESTANFDGLSPRKPRPPSGRHCRQHQKHRRGTVIHDQRRLCPSQRAQQPGDLAHAATALVALPLDLQRDRVGGRLAHRLGRLGAHRRATEIGVDDDAGGIEHRSQPRPLQCSEGVEDASLDLWPVQRLAGEELLAHLVQLGPSHTRQHILGQFAAPPFGFGHDRRDWGYCPKPLPVSVGNALAKASTGGRVAARGGIRVRHGRRIRNENGSGGCRSRCGRGERIRTSDLSVPNAAR